MDILVGFARSVGFTKFRDLASYALQKSCQLAAEMSHHYALSNSHVSMEFAYRT